MVDGYDVPCRMQNEECRIMVFPAEIILLVGRADTYILHFAFIILHLMTEMMRKNGPGVSPALILF